MLDGNCFDSDFCPLSYDTWNTGMVAVNIELSTIFMLMNILYYILIFCRDRRSNVSFCTHGLAERSARNLPLWFFPTSHGFRKLSDRPNNPITPSKHQPPRPATQKTKTQVKESEHISGFGSYRFFSHALEHLGPPSTPCKAVGWLPPMHLGVMHPENKYECRWLRSGWSVSQIDLSFKGS